MNKLYAILISGHESTIAGSYYAKKYFPAVHTDRTRKICEDMLHGIPESKLPMFVCYLCTAVGDTIFGQDIIRLDPENTYVEFTRDPAASGDDARETLWSITKSEKDMRWLYKWLDQDIKDRLMLPGWLDIMAALCLQMLRELK